ncbi:hypothetical protein WMY93_028459 [Mugilogobius chulae]|uniref:Uncharacterized protein n=1 Tax=Mugilogobius chulae TaxID=88201 RepID=A0AAW0MQB3_9GOBI
MLHRSGRREFHSRGAERLKALPPHSDEQANGTESWREEEKERRERQWLASAAVASHPKPPRSSRDTLLQPGTLACSSVVEHTIGLLKGRCRCLDASEGKLIYRHPSSQILLRHTSKSAHSISGER